jgi:hypothetical protein
MKWATVLTLVWVGLAAAGQWTLEADTGLSSGYAFRGEQRLASTALVNEAQARWDLSRHFACTARGLNVTSLGDYDGTVENRLEASARWRVCRRATLVGGWLYYDRNRARPQGTDTAEAYGGLETRCWGWRPACYAFYGYRAGKVGTYLLGTLARTWDVGTAGWRLAALGALGAELGRGARGLRNGLVSIDLGYPIADGLEFGPRVDVHVPVAKVDGGQVHAYAGLGFHWARGF